jgi:glycosyltransferase involved in cell wall biosynthesis
MSTIRLSYVTTTFDKLPYLKEVYARLLKHRQPDEEIIAIDGGSTDGTVEFLTNLKNQGKIDFFLSERDKGESNGTNKGMLAAKGDLIKIITDDDSFHYPGIRECRQYMLENPQIDLLGTEGASINWKRTDPIRASDTRPEYRRYREEGIPFPFCGLGWMIRRSSLPLLGLFDTSFSRMDAEYTLRVTAGKGVVAWYTGYTWARILNPKSNSKNLKTRQAKERMRLNAFYGIAGYNDLLDPQPFSNRLKSYLAPILKPLKPTRKPSAPIRIPSLSEGFEIADQWLAEVHAKEPGRFL